MKILVADDNEITRLTLGKLLTARGYEVVVARDGTEAYELLQQEDSPKLALLDWLMPGMSGIDVCRRIRASHKSAYVYMIMLSAQGEKHHFRAGMEAGADDYISKPFDIGEVHLRLRAGERIVRLQEQLRVEARVDDLTQTFNRGAIIGILRRALAYAERDKAPLSLLMVDVDNFKQVNDTYGHPVGDLVLRHIAHVLRTPLRAYDALGRYGGEEFLIVLPGCGASGALEVAERVRSSVADKPVSTAAGSIVATVSLGIALEEGKMLHADQMIVQADEALYRAKRAGRNRVELSG